MSTFADFLQQRLDSGGFTTEDALATFLPLVRQVVAAHQGGLVAPLQGTASLHVEHSRLWFEDAQLHKPVLNASAIQALRRPATQAMDIVDQVRVDLHDESVVSLRVGQRGQPVTAPVYLPGYVSWEHELGQHDPLTDIFVLGLILASLTCNLDLHQPEQLARFVQHHHHLFTLNEHLHPVLAKVVARMTELDRQRRPQDLAAILYTLENYRDQNVDFEYDLARLPAWSSADRGGRRALILSCLQQRLFDISRRNRLLHFRATMQSINLTWASVPLTFDFAKVRPEQILTWDHAFKKAILAGNTVPLNKFLRFEEALYLPGQLEAIRTEARHNQTEYGFAQLRLVLCFLRWANLKEKPPQRFDSPLVLLPVRLDKTKGVRDVFTLEPLSSQAEINPVLRHYLKQLYAVDLPEMVELTESALDELHVYLASKVQASEPAVTIEKIDRPRINLIQASARRRLDQYRRRARLSGRGVRVFEDLDYSYDRDNYHPLGLRLFQTRILSPEPRLRTLVAESPRPRSFMTASETALSVEKERRLFAPAEDETNPYRWTFDLCSVTLGNFHYRKMSLVRDYDMLLARQEAHEGFDAVFSLQPRASLADSAAPLPLEESFPIVDCDPTQLTAVARARSGHHFIIQGPPGTGKSQTITNLIADYVARGQRVLFVCEKRAAIDVVYHRLQQVGLHPLCCLIHDSQEDKKEFILDLKQTYEASLDTKQGRSAKTEAQRCRLLEDMRRELSPLEQYHATLRAAPARAGVSVHQLLLRTLELRGLAPELSPRSREILPSYQLWQENRAGLGRAKSILESIQGDSVLARHPLQRLHARFVREEQPLAAVTQALARVEELLASLLAALRELALPPETWDALGKVQQLINRAGAMEGLARRSMVALLDPASAPTRKLAQYGHEIAAKEQEWRRAQRHTKGWREKPSADETWTALQQARALEKSSFPYLWPSWWRLRRLMRRCYEIHAHKVQPSWSHVLSKLLPEQRLEAELEESQARARGEFSFEGPYKDFAHEIAQLVESGIRQPAYVQEAQLCLASAEQGHERVLRLVALKPLSEQLAQELSTLVLGTEDLTFDQLHDALALVEESLDELPAFLPCLQELANLPAPLANAWRGLDVSAEQLEAALVDRTLEELSRGDPALARFNGTVRAGHLQRLEQLHGEWQTANAATVRDRVCQRFLDHVRIAGLSNSQLSEEQKNFKAPYNRGRRELEHEFSKTMRYRSIRDLVAGDAGLVLQDLKPVWLMSPLSVSDTLPLEGALFDVVIFDEASQVPLEEAVPALFRARQVLVVGDEMQLPPTSFFASRQLDEEGLLLKDDSGREVEYDLSSNSFLTHAARNLPSTLLGWHYRSRSESLISFSNAAFYQGRLRTVPDVAMLPEGLQRIHVQTAAEGTDNVKRLLDRPVSYHFLQHGVYLARRNLAEADYIAHLVRGLLARALGLSIGIIAFSEAQQDAIEQALARLAHEDDTFRARLEAEWEREQDGQFVGLLVKNLENIQGDERDVILLSVCYGQGPTGKMLMNFGPINQQGGERRLNVAFSRAKQHMAVVASIRHEAITNDYNDGARALKNYLRYADALSAGDPDGAGRVLWEINPAEETRSKAQPEDRVIAELAGRLREHGYHVDLHVGQSEFRCDLAVRAAAERAYRLAILVDTEAYYQQGDVLERDVLRPRLLRRFGWTVLLVLTKDWLEDENVVLRTILTVLSGTASVSAPPEGPAPWQTTLELGEKFWEIRVAGPEHTVRFGRRGTTGQTRTKTFPDATAADRDARRLLAEKEAKGYQQAP
jgi:hypothetical protein